MGSTVCIFEGEDAAPEAVIPTVKLLNQMELGLEFTSPPVENHTKALKQGIVPDEIQGYIDEADSVLFGSASNTLIPVLFYLRWFEGNGKPLNVRPIRYISGVSTPLSEPDDIDYLLLRENLEGMYVGHEGKLSEFLSAVDNPTGLANRRLEEFAPGKYATRIISDRNAQRFASLATEFARNHKVTQRTTITCATKANVLSETDGLFKETFEDTIRKYSELEYQHIHVDDLAQKLVSSPDELDVVVLTNQVGDMLSGVGAATIGGLGIAPSGCYGEEKAYFEPAHGTAPDIQDENIINPTATILSAVMMLEYLDKDHAAEMLTTAVEEVYSDGEPLTPDQGGQASTTKFVEAVAGKL